MTKKTDIICKSDECSYCIDKKCHHYDVLTGKFKCTQRKRK